MKVRAVYFLAFLDGGVDGGGGGLTCGRFPAVTVAEATVADLTVTEQTVAVVMVVAAVVVTVRDMCSIVSIASHIPCFMSAVAMSIGNAFNMLMRSRTTRWPACSCRRRDASSAVTKLSTVQRYLPLTMVRYLTALPLAFHQLCMGQQMSTGAKCEGKGMKSNGQPGVRAM